MPSTYTPVINAPKQCPYCEENFTPKNKLRTYCYTTACQREHKRLAMREYNAKHKALHGITPTQKYRPAGTPRAPRKTHTKTCGQCEGEYQTKDNRTRYCSLQCYGQSNTKGADLVKYIKPRFHMPTRTVGRGFTEGPCAECGERFTAIGGTALYCSDTCSTRRQLRARARKRGKFAIDTATRHAIYERDGWECHLCRQPVPTTWEPSDPDSPSLDHIIPRSWTLVPDDSPTNLALAHRKCNVYRGNRSVEEFRAEIEGVAGWGVSSWR